MGEATPTEPRLPPMPTPVGFLFRPYSIESTQKAAFHQGARPVADATSGSPGGRSARQPAAATGSSFLSYPPLSPLQSTGPSMMSGPHALSTIVPSSDAVALQRRVSELRNLSEEYRCRAERSEAQRDELQADRNALREELERCAASRKGTGVAGSSISGRSDTARHRTESEELQSLRQQLAAHAAEAASCREQAQKHQSELENLRNLYEAAKEAGNQERERLSQEAAESRLLAQARSRQVAAAEESLSRTKQQLQEAGSTAMVKEQALQKEVADLRLQLEHKEKQLEDGEKKHESQGQLIESMQADSAQMQAERKQMQADLAAARTQLEWCDSRIAQLLAGDLTAVVKRYDAELQQLKDAARQQRQAMEGALESERSRVAALTQELSVLQNQLRDQAGTVCEHAAATVNHLPPQPQASHAVSVPSPGTAMHGSACHQAVESTVAGASEARKEEVLLSALGLADDNERTCGSPADAGKPDVAYTSTASLRRDRLLATARAEIERLKDVNDRLMASRGKRAKGDVSKEQLKEALKQERERALLREEEVAARCAREWQERLAALDATGLQLRAQADRSRAQAATLRLECESLQVHMQESEKEAKAEVQELKKELDAARAQASEQQEEVAMLRLQLEAQHETFVCQIEQMKLEVEADAQMAIMESSANNGQHAAQQLQRLELVLSARNAELSCLRSLLLQQHRQQPPLDAPGGQLSGVPAPAGGQEHARISLPASILDGSLGMSESEVEALLAAVSCSQVGSSMCRMHSVAVGPSQPNSPAQSPRRAAEQQQLPATAASSAQLARPCRAEGKGLAREQGRAEPSAAPASPHSTGSGADINQRIRQLHVSGTTAIPRYASNNGSLGCDSDCDDDAEAAGEGHPSLRAAAANPQDCDRGAAGASGGPAHAELQAAASAAPVSGALSEGSMPTGSSRCESAPGPGAGPGHVGSRSNRPNSADASRPRPLTDSASPEAAVLLVPRGKGTSAHAGPAKTAPTDDEATGSSLEAAPVLPAAAERLQDDGLVAAASATQRSPLSDVSNAPSPGGSSRADAAHGAASGCSKGAATPAAAAAAAAGNGDSSMLGKRSRRVEASEAEAVLPGPDDEHASSRNAPTGDAPASAALPSGPPPQAALATIEDAMTHSPEAHRWLVASQQQQALAEELPGLPPQSNWQPVPLKARAAQRLAQQAHRRAPADSTMLGSFSFSSSLACDGRSAALEALQSKSSMGQASSSCTSMEPEADDDMCCLSLSMDEATAWHTRDRMRAACANASGGSGGGGGGVVQTGGRPGPWNDGQAALTLDPATGVWHINPLYRQSSAATDAGSMPAFHSALWPPRAEHHAAPAQQRSSTEAAGGAYQPSRLRIASGAPAREAGTPTGPCGLGEAVRWLAGTKSSCVTAAAAGQAGAGFPPEARSLGMLPIPMQLADQSLSSMSSNGPWAAGLPAASGCEAQASRSSGPRWLAQVQQLMSISGPGPAAAGSLPFIAAPLAAFGQQPQPGFGHRSKGVHSVQPASLPKHQPVGRHWHRPPQQLLTLQQGGTALESMEGRAALSRSQFHRERSREQEEEARKHAAAAAHHETAAQQLRSQQLQPGALRGGPHILSSSHMPAGNA